VNALTDEQVGKYLNDHFVSAFQKVGTFQIVNGEKNGGNVASYFCLSDGSVLHALAGPVDAATLLREARWVVENRKLAMIESRGDHAKYQAFFSKAHGERLRHDHRVEIGPRGPADESSLASLQPVDKRGRPRKLPAQGQVHWLLASHPLVKIDQVYPTVFEKILGETLSTLPVNEQ
jgi:hypothetical protein